MQRALGRSTLLPLLLIALTTVCAAFSTPERNGWVTDQAGILDQDTADTLARRLRDIQHDTGDEVVVVTLSSLQGTTIEDWGNLLGDTWKIGKAGKDSGVLLVVAPNDRKVRIAVGYGLSNRIPDSVAETIIADHILPYFRSGDFKAGIRAGIESIAIQLDPATPVAPPTRSAASAWPSFQQLFPSRATLKSFAFWGAIVLVVLVMLIFNAAQVGPRRRWDDYDDNGWGFGHRRRRSGFWVGFGSDGPSVGWSGSSWGSSSSSSSSWSSSSSSSSGGSSSGGGSSFGGGASGSW